MLARVPLWLAFGVSLMQALFFVAAAILPRDTVGPPAFDRPLLREGMWMASGQPFLFLLACVAALLTVFTGARAGRLKTIALALGLMLAAHAVLLSETSLLIERGELAVSIAQGNRVILATRIVSTALAVASFILMAREVARQLLREA